MKTTCIAIAVAMTCVAATAAEIRVGMIGLDTSHSIAFTKHLNVTREKPEYRDFRVTVAYQWGSRDIVSSTNRYPEYCAQVRDMGVEIVPTLDELLAKCDVVLLETNDGREHLEQAKAVFKAGKRVFIDKPLAADFADSAAICKAARELGGEFFTSSALRYGAKVREARAGKFGKIRGADCWTCISYEPAHSRFYWYGIHAVEPLYALLGTGCESVTCLSGEDGDVAVGKWKDGRLGVMRGLRVERKGAPYGGVIFTETGKVDMGGYEGYADELSAILEFFKTGKVPVAPEESLEVMAFMRAAELSLERGGVVVPIDEVMATARGEDGFVPMFNGRDLAGWEGATNTYCVTPEGYLTCTQSDGIGESGAKNLWTTRDYTNFVIRFDVKLPPNANNGLGIRTPPNGWCSREGMELQLLDDWGDLYNGSNRLADVHYTGAIYGVVAPARKVNGDSYLKKSGEWNSVEVTADGPRVKFVLNGATLVDADVSEYSTDGTVPADGICRPGLHNKAGRIHWCGHGHNIFWRNIRIKEIR